MGTIYLFDVDGTLTPAKTTIDPEFKKNFLNWSVNKEFYIISGGSFVRIVDQLGESILDQCSGVFACMANIFLQKNDLINPSGFNEWEIIYKNQFTAPKGLRDTLKRVVKDSPSPLKGVTHQQERTGMLNFSIVGHEATPAQRAQYSSYDNEHSERTKIVEELKTLYPKLDFVIGGAVSIDIFNVGHDKSQVIERYFEEAIEHNQIIFVGDRIAFPGNDYALATALQQHSNGRTYEVESWQDTAELLKTEAFA